MNFIKKIVNEVMTELAEESDPLSKLAQGEKRH